MQHSSPTLAFKSLIHLLHILSLNPHHRLLPLAVLLRLLLPLLSRTPSGFFIGMLEVSEQGPLNCYIFFCPILLILSVSRNLVSTHRPLSGYLDSLLCNLIAPTPGLAFSLVMPPTLAAASSFSSGRVYLSLNFFHFLSLRLIPILIMYGVKISPNSTSLFVLNAYAPPIRSSLSDNKSNSFSLTIFSSFRNLFIFGDFNYHYPLWDSKGASNLRGGGSIRLGHLL